MSSNKHLTYNLHIGPLEMPNLQAVILNIQT